jgi:hypothetical protein
MRKTALLTGVAGLFLMTAPAFAQDSTAPQTPPAATTEAPTLTLRPGATVRGSDGELGTLVGARLNGGRQQLTVQGADGLVRAVPIDGIRQEGDVVVVDFTLEQYNAADTVTQPATPATPAEPGVTPATPATPAVPGVRNEIDADDDTDDGEVAEEDQDRRATPAVPANPATPAEPGMTPAVPATPAQPAIPPEQTPPTLPPENPASPRPGEGPGSAPGKPNG